MREFTNLLSDDLHTLIKHSFLLNFLDELSILYFVSSILFLCKSKIHCWRATMQINSSFDIFQIRQFLVNEHGQITELDIRIVIGQNPITCSASLFFIISPPYFKFRIFLGRPSEYHRVT
jgi:hypothetical protein